MDPPLRRSESEWVSTRHRSAAVNRRGGGLEGGEVVDAVDPPSEWVSTRNRLAAGCEVIRRCRRVVRRWGSNSDESPSPLFSSPFKKWHPNGNRPTPPAAAPALRRSPRFSNAAAAAAPAVDPQPPKKKAKAKAKVQAEPEAEAVSAEAPPSPAADGFKSVIIEHCKQCSSFKTRANQVKKALEKDVRLVFWFSWMGFNGE